MTSRHSIERNFVPVELNLSGVTLASERTSNTLSCTGYGILTVYVNLSAWTTASAVVVAVDVTPDSGTTWIPVQSESIAGGVGTLSDYTVSNAGSAADQFMGRFTLDDDTFRIRISGTSGAAGDVVSVWARLSNNRS